MNRMQYDFKLEDAIRFATTQGARTKNFGDELQFEYCPYCHGGRNRDKWTFSISKKNGAFNCMRSSCGVKGNMITLAEQFGLELDKDISAYYNLNNYNNKFKKFKDAHREIEVRSPAIEYLKSRGISEHITRKYEITTAPDEPNKLIFPLYQLLIFS